MAVFITKESNSTLVSIRSSNGNREDYYINSPSNLIVEDDVLKIKFDGINNGMDQDILTIAYSEINDKLSSSTLSEYINTALSSNYFLGSTISGEGTTNAADLTEGVLADARVQESNVTQHEGALSISSSQVNGTFGTGNYADQSVTEAKLSTSVQNKINNNVKSSTTGEPTGSDVVTNVVSLTQAEYDAGTPVAGTFYLITG